MSEHVSTEVGYLVIVEAPEGPASLDRAGKSIKDVAVYVMENFDYFLSNDTIRAIEDITSSGGAASVAVDLDASSRSFEMTIFRSKVKLADDLKQD